MPENANGAPRRLSILGSTGSIGVNTLDLVGWSADGRGAPFKVEALTAFRNVDLLIEQARKHRPSFVAIGDESHYDRLKEGLADADVEVGAGASAIAEAASRPSDLVMAAIVGAAGLKPTLEAARRGADIALANKECLVCAGPLFLDAVRTGGGRLLPVDSEHNAIFQVFDAERPERVTRLILTASGGPFRTWSAAQMAAATPDQAVAHPNWSMGAKISVDSATMMNKGLELIEAAHLFPVDQAQIEILVHPQSVIHSMVEYIDGSVLAQLGSPDMRTPIAYALAWPDRMGAPSPKLDFAEVARLDFETPDLDRFPALRLAREALIAGDAAPTVLNAANEVAVAAFLEGRIGFLDIAKICEQVLHETTNGGSGTPGALSCLEDAYEADQIARRIAGDRLEASTH